MGFRYRLVRDLALQHVDAAGQGAVPGDGLPKPVSFPDPADPAVTLAGDRFRILALPKLVELKLASGMTAPHRLKDLDQPERLAQLAIAGLAADFPPIRSLEPRSGLPVNIPIFVSSETRPHSRLREPSTPASAPRDSIACCC